MFATGSKHVPPAGFGTHPSVSFLQEEIDGYRSQFPKANTCSCTLHLPVMHKTYDAFKDALNMSFTCAHGFGYA